MTASGTSGFTNAGASSRVSRRLHKAAHWIAFAIGLAIIVDGTLFAWSGVGTFLLRIVSVQEQRELANFRYGCPRAECEQCLSGIDQHPDAVVLTGASGAMYGYDLATLQQATSRPIVNCMMTHIELEQYTVLFNTRNELRPGQMLVHLINSWVPIAPTSSYWTWASPQPAPSGPLSTEGLWNFPNIGYANVKLITAYLMLNFRELQVKSRTAMRRAYPKAADALAFFPFSETEHIAGKERLMQRWVRMSPWLKQYIQSSLVLPTPEQVKNRSE